MKRMLAFYKSDGSVWTLDELLQIQDYVGQENTSVHLVQSDGKPLETRKYIYDMNGYQTWGRQLPKENPEKFTIVDFNELFPKKQIKTFKIKEYK